MTQLAERLWFPLFLAIIGFVLLINVQVEEIAAGLALFLLGMMSMEAGFKAFTGGTLQRFLERAAGTPEKSLLFGIVTTTLMQSSSLVSLITISFISAGLMSLSAGIGVIFGANIGTTTGAWLMAAFGLKIKLSAYAMPMLVFGVILQMTRKSAWQGMGRVLVGIGLIFLGIQTMKHGFDALAAHIDLTRYALPGLTGLIVYTLLGIVMTTVFQSSHATLLLTITALAAGQVTYENALALAIGANIGTTITAILGAINADINGKRLAGAHLIFNLLTGAIALLAIVPLSGLVSHLGDWMGLAADDYTLRLSLFHTLFNVIGVAVLWPVRAHLERLLQQLIREHETRRQVETRPPQTERRTIPTRARFVTGATLRFADAALQAALSETHFLMAQTRTLIQQSLDRTRLASGSTLTADDFEQAYCLNVREIYNDLIMQLPRIRTRLNLTEEQAEALDRLREAATEMIEAAKDTKHVLKHYWEGLQHEQRRVAEFYSGFATLVMQTLDTLKRLGDLHDDEAFELECDRLMMRIESADLFRSGQLDAAIVHGQVPRDWIAALTNDNHYVQSLCQRLLRATRTLHHISSEGYRDTHAALALTADDVDAILAHKDATEQDARS